jgi:hypothetical protein
VTLRQLSEDEQSEAKLFYALQDYNAAEEEYERQVSRDPASVVGAVGLGLLIGGGLLLVLWCLTQSVR